MGFGNFLNKVAKNTIGQVGRVFGKVAKPATTAIDQTAGRAGRELHRGLNNYLDEVAYAAAIALAWPAITYAAGAATGGVGASAGTTQAAQAQLASTAAAKSGVAAGATTGSSASAAAARQAFAEYAYGGATAGASSASSATAARQAFAEYAGTAKGAEEATTAAKLTKAAKTAGKVVGAVNTGGQVLGALRTARSTDDLQAQLDANEAAIREAMRAEGTGPAIPTPSDEALRNARKRALALQKSRRGRTASILSERGRQPLG